jgi:plasmid stabilization system protein ParE
MSRSLRILERARADVDAIFDWIVQRSVQGAIAWYLAFRRAIARIESDPETFAEAAEAHALQRPLREVPFKTRRGRTYRVVFEVFDTEIMILRIRGPGPRALRQRDMPHE